MSEGNCRLVVTRLGLLATRLEGARVIRVEGTQVHCAVRRRTVAHIRARSSPSSSRPSAIISSKIFAGLCQTTTCTLRSGGGPGPGPAGCGAPLLPFKRGHTAVTIPSCLSLVAVLRY